jgi:hypothetical protein
MTHIYRYSHTSTPTGPTAMIFTSVLPDSQESQAIGYDKDFNQLWQEKTTLSIVIADALVTPEGSHYLFFVSLGEDACQGPMVDVKKYDESHNLLYEKQLEKYPNHYDDNFTSADYDTKTKNIVVFETILDLA